MESVYLETSVIGYLASRSASDIIIASNQLLTQDWWENHRLRFELFVSQSVLDECSAGDPIAAAERFVFLKSVPVLAINQNTRMLADELLMRVGLPAKAAVDALHIAVAALNGIDYLLTWNCKHIANPAFRHKIDVVLEDHGIDPPVICTPQELINV